MELFQIFGIIPYFCNVDTYNLGKVKRTEGRHAPEMSKQTGFPSPATHYLEAPIDLNKELVYHQDATFFIRINGNSYKEYNVFDKDVLIVDRSLKFYGNRLALIIAAGEFDIKAYKDVSAENEILVWGIITYIIHNTL